MLRNPAANVGCRLQEGESGEVHDNLGRTLVAAGLAKCLDQPPEVIVTIPDEPIKAVPHDPPVQAGVQPDQPTEIANEATPETETTAPAESTELNHIPRKRGKNHGRSNVS